MRAPDKHKMSKAARMALSRATKGITNCKTVYKHGVLFAVGIGASAAKAGMKPNLMSRIVNNDKVPFRYRDLIGVYTINKTFESKGRSRISESTPLRDLSIC